MRKGAGKKGHGANPWLLIYEYFFVWDARPSPKALRALLFAIVAAGVVLGWQYAFPRQDPLWVDNSHATLSLEIAVNRVRFGAISHISGRFGSMLVNRPDALPLQVLSLPERTGLPLSKYVSGIVPFRNNENGLMLVMDLILRVNHNITVRGLMSTLRGCHFGLILISAFLLLYLGSSPVFTLVLCVLAVDIVDRIDTIYSMVLYPFLFPIMLLLSVFFAFMLKGYPIRAGFARASVVGFLSGLFVAFCGNFRTSYYPVAVALYLLYFALSLFPFNRDGVNRNWKIVALSCLLLSFVFGNWAFDRAFIRPLRNLPVRSNPEYHVIMHPLVLGLAVPGNDLTRREGIVWLDQVGLQLARRISPNVEYLSPEYEQALKTYYRGLWSSHPQEMLGTYWLKLGYSAQSLARFINNVSMDRRSALMCLAKPLLAIDNGLYTLSFMTILALIGIFPPRNLRMDQVALRYLLAGFAIVGLLMFLEMTVIESNFAITLHATLAFFSVGTCLLAYQVAANLISFYWRRSTEKSEATARARNYRKQGKRRNAGR